MSPENCNELSHRVLMFIRRTSGFGQMLVIGRTSGKGRTSVRPYESGKSGMLRLNSNLIVNLVSNMTKYPRIISWQTPSLDPNYASKVDGFLALFPNNTRTRRNLWCT